MKIENMGQVKLAVAEAGVKVEKQIAFLADALEQKIDYDEHEEAAAALFPVVHLLRAIAEQTHLDFENLWGEINSLQERMGKPDAA